MTERDFGEVTDSFRRFDHVSQEALNLALTSATVGELSDLLQDAGLYPGYSEVPFDRLTMGFITQHNGLHAVEAGVPGHRKTVELNTLRAFARLAEERREPEMYADARALLRKEGIRGKLSSLALGFLNPFVDREMTP